MIDVEHVWPVADVSVVGNKQASMQYLPLPNRAPSQTRLTIPCWHRLILQALVYSMQSLQHFVSCDVVGSFGAGI